MARPELERRLAVLVEPLERAVLDGVREFEGEPDRVRVELGVVPVFVDERPLIGLAGLLDWRSSGQLSAILRSGFFVGTTDERLLTPGERRWPCDRLVLVGVGSRGEFDVARARLFATRCVEIATGLAARTVLIALPSGQDIERSLIEAAFDSLLEAIERSSIAPTHEAPTPELSTPELSTAEIESPALESRPDDPLEAAAAVEAKAALVPAPEVSERSESRWWVVADQRVVARLRRVRSGPPRAADAGPSLYT